MNLHKKLQDALLDISDSDKVENRRLLSEAGIDPKRLVNNSLNNISRYRSDLEKRAANDGQLLDVVKNKINRLLVQAPIQTSEFLTGYFRQHSLPPVRFGATGQLNRKTLSAAKDQLDLNDLSKKLDEQRGEG